MAGTRYSEKVSRDPNALIFMPDRAYIEALKVGDYAPNSFGRMCEVVEITYRGLDVNGRLFVCYYTAFGRDARISHSLKEGRIDRTVALSNRYSSADIDRLEGLEVGEEFF